MKRVRNLLLFTVITLTLAVLATGTYLSYQQARALVYPPEISLPAPPETFNGLQDVSFRTVDGLRLSGWYIPPAAETGAVVLFVHGHAGNRGQFIAEADLIINAGYGALLFDLRNSGDSDGDRTTMGLHEVRDVIAAFEFVSGQPGVQDVVLFGRSMGGATAIRAMPALPDARGLIVDTAYTSLNDVIGDGVTSLTGLPPFPWDRITVLLAGNMAGDSMRAVRPIDVVGDIAPRPILFLHGTRDRTILPAHTQRLYDAAGEPKARVLIDGGGHSDLFQVAPETVGPAILNFLADSLS
jgi:uncharacterized protein